MPAPASGKTPKLTPVQTQGLAYYSSGDLGVLAPRGWRCFGLLGSNGSTLIVTPEMHGQDLFGSEGPLKGPAIQLSVSFGGTSGRFEAAEVAARLFPSRRAFVRSVMEEDRTSVSEFRQNPYPADRLTRRGPDLVEFETPGGQDGEGTRSRLVRTADPISGFARMDVQNDVTKLSVRLPPSLRYLAPAIVVQTERADPAAGL